MNGGNYICGIHGIQSSFWSIPIWRKQQTASKSTGNRTESINTWYISNPCVQSEKSYFQKSVSWGSKILEKMEKWRVSDFFTGKNFIVKIFPILWDLTCSHREGNWQLHLFAVQRALPLDSAFDRTNYKCWLPVYFEDC